ncbi:MAG: glycosyltransferase [Vicinamibacteria bacterium]
MADRRIPNPSINRSRNPAGARVLYLCYADIREPLIQSQVLPYLRGLSKGGLRMHLLTFQQSRVTAAERAAIRTALRRDGLGWHSLRYHRKPSLPATLFDIAAGALVTFALCVRYRIRTIHARSHVPAAMAMVSKWILGAKLIFDMRGLLAEEYVDAGRWRPGGLTYRLVKAMEQVFFRRADAIVMLTDAIRKELTAGPPLSTRQEVIEVIPCCADVARFQAVNREASRSRFGWRDDLVLVYVGKVGTWYLPERMAEFFARLQRSDPRWFFAVFTQAGAQLFQDALARAGVAQSRRLVTELQHEQVPEALVAADAGVSFIQPSYSKRASSPTKLGEYLAAGLPVVANAGIGDSQPLIEESRVGVVLNDFTEQEYRRATAGLGALLADPDHGPRSRRVAEERLGLRTVGWPAYARVYARIAAL